MKLFICLLAAILAVTNASQLIGGANYLNSGYLGYSGLSSYGSGLSSYGSGLSTYGSGVERVVRVVEAAPAIQYLPPAPFVYRQVQQPVQTYKILAQPTIHVPAASYVKYVNLNSAPAYSGSWKKK